jgi:hypothetical protein
VGIMPDFKNVNIFNNQNVYQFTEYTNKRDYILKYVPIDDEHYVKMQYLKAHYAS